MRQGLLISLKMESIEKWGDLAQHEAGSVSIVVAYETTKKLELDKIPFTKT